MFSCKFKDTTTTTMFKFTEKHDKNHETNDKAHTHTRTKNVYTYVLLPLLPLSTTHHYYYYR